MVALKAPALAGSLSVHGVVHEIKDGFVEVDDATARHLVDHHEFEDPRAPKAVVVAFADNAISQTQFADNVIPITRDALDKVLRDLGIMTAANIPADKLIEALQEGASRQAERLAFELQAAERRADARVADEVAAAEQRVLDTLAADKPAGDPDAPPESKDNPPPPPDHGAEVTKNL